MEFVFGGSIVLHRRFLLSLVVALSLSTLAFANSATVNMTFLYPGPNVSGGYYTYPYYFSINGGKATPMMCDSFNNHITVGENWNANVSGLLSGKGLFGKDVRDYKAAGIIFRGVVTGRSTPKSATGRCGTFSSRASRRTPRCWPSTATHYFWRNTLRRTNLKAWCCTRLSAEARATDRRNSSAIEERPWPHRNLVA